MKAIDSAVLESQEHRDLLDIVDKFRSGGVGRYIDLPQIVVCGDQSSGKSSVLEAISGMAFPTKDSLCTRFATEVILRRAPASSVKFSIAPAADRPAVERKRLQEFAPMGSLETLDLGGVVEEARALMGVGEHKAFSSDVLRVELSGPQQPHLTMVDLPGLFRAGNREQSAEDADLVRDLVLSYMKRERTIILAVVSAKSDFALQEVTQLARQLDPKGIRTLGLITKPDTLDAGSDSESAYLKLARNHDVHFRLGWHVLRNRDYASRAATLEQRNQAEAHFFSQGVWASISPMHVGVGTLRQRLTSVLHDQVLSQLPKVVTDLEERAQECRVQLQKIGPSRSTIQLQRQYLIQASHQFYKLMKDASDGNYTDPFFAAADDEGQEKRLRAVIQNSLINLTSEMQTDGRAREIVDGDPKDVDEVNREDFLHEVEGIISTNRGRELPGTYNPAIIGTLFRNQSKPWRGILQRRANWIRNDARAAVQGVLEHLLDNDVMEGVFRWILNAALEEIGHSLKCKLDEIMLPHEMLHPITYSRSLAQLVRERRLAKQEAEIKKAMANATLSNGKLSTDTLVRSLVLKARLDLDYEASSDAVDWMEAYYDVSMARAVDDFSVLAVECCLVQKLPGLFSPEVVYLLDDETVRRIAAEDDATAAERARLTDMLSVLEAGLADLRQRTGYQSGARGTRLPLHVQPRPGSEPALEGVSKVVNGVTPTRAAERIPDSPLSEAQPPPPPPAEEVYDGVGVKSKKDKKKATLRPSSVGIGSLWEDEPTPEPGPEPEPEKDEWGMPYTSKKDKEKKAASIWDEPEPALEPEPEKGLWDTPTSKKIKKKKKRPSMWDDPPPEPEPPVDLDG